MTLLLLLRYVSLLGVLFQYCKLGLGFAAGEALIIKLYNEFWKSYMWVWICITRAYSTIHVYLCLRNHFNYNQQNNWIYN